MVYVAFVHAMTDAGTLEQVKARAKALRAQGEKVVVAQVPEDVGPCEDTEEWFLRVNGLAEKIRDTIIEIRSGPNAYTHEHLKQKDNEALMRVFRIVTERFPREDDAQVDDGKHDGESSIQASILLRQMFKWVGEWLDPGVVGVPTLKDEAWWNGQLWLVKTVIRMDPDTRPYAVHHGPQFEAACSGIPNALAMYREMHRLHRAMEAGEIDKETAGQKYNEFIKEHI